MDFNRSGQSRPTVPAASAAGTAQPKNSSGGSHPDWKHGKLYRIAFLALLVSGTVLFIAMILFLVFGRPINREAKYVDGDKYQAVFVNVNGTNGGQVYFGKITSLTSQYIRLANVFYIQNQTTNGSTTSSNYNLVKLGCELHGPEDEMLINRDQVFFWENLKNDGQVAQKAAEWYKANPNGQKCDTANSTNTTTQSDGTTQSSGTTTTPSTTTPTTNGTSTTPRP